MWSGTLPTTQGCPLSKCPSILQICAARAIPGRTKSHRRTTQSDLAVVLVRQGRRPGDRTRIQTHSDSTAGLFEASTKTPVEEFVIWAVTNGVEGIGRADSKVALFESDDGERGVGAIQPISEGEVVLRIPSRVAIVDMPEDSELVYEGAPWSVRLACKLLILKNEGPESPWYPYISALPALVPAVLQTFEWSDMKEIEYSDMADKIAFDNWLMVDSWQRLSPDATGGATRDEYDWAMSIVHSRSFGAIGEGGSMSAHMLIPCVDMFNHAGDCTNGLLSSDASATDNVRWEYEKNNKDTGSKSGEIVVYASSDISEGEEVLLSYGERSNDDFFLHYGFVPPRNPQDEVVLFPNLVTAIDWYCKRFAVEGDVESLKKSALEVGNKEDNTPIHPTNTTKSAQAMQEEASKLRLMAGSFVDGRLLAAFKFLSTGTDMTEKTAVAQRCWDMLGRMRLFTQDLEVLAGYDDDFAAFSTFYSQAIEKYSQAIGELPGTSSPLPTEMSSALQLAYTFRAYKKMILWDILLDIAKQ